MQGRGCGRCRAVVESGRIKPQIDFSYIFSGRTAGRLCVSLQSELKSDIEVKVKLQKEEMKNLTFTIMGAWTIFVLSILYVFDAQENYRSFLGALAISAALLEPTCEHGYLL